MKGKKLYIPLLVMVIGIISTLGIVVYLLINNEEQKDLKTDKQTKVVVNMTDSEQVNNRNPLDENIEPETMEWTSLRYDFIPTINPEFLIKYPSDWEDELHLGEPGGADLILKQKGSVMEVNFTGIDDYPYELIIQQVATNFGSYEFSYELEKVEAGYISDNELIKAETQGAIEYELWRLIDNSKEISYMALAKPAFVGEGQGWLSIWDKSGENREVVKKILASVTVI